MIGITPRGPLIPSLRRRHWVPPTRGHSSLHCASAHAGSLAAVGAIIRDHDGGFLGALAGLVGASFGRATDLLSLRWSVMLSEHIAAPVVEFWSSSGFLVENIDLPCPLWNYLESWTTIRFYFHCHGSRIRLAPRAGNAIAGALAVWGLSLDRVMFVSTHDRLTLHVRRALIRDARAYLDPGG